MWLLLSDIWRTNYVINARVSLMFFKNISGRFLRYRIVYVRRKGMYKFKESKISFKTDSPPDYFWLSAFSKCSNQVCHFLMRRFADAKNQTEPNRVGAYDSKLTSVPLAEDLHHVGGSHFAFVLWKKKILKSKYMFRHATNLLFLARCAWKRLLSC